MIIKTRVKGIQLTVELISDSRAKGCFVLVQCGKGKPDYYRALLRTGHTASGFVGISSAENTACKVIVYDIEEDGLPNRNPADVIEDITVNGHSKLKYNNVFSLAQLLLFAAMIITIIFSTALSYTCDVHIMSWPTQNKTTMEFQNLTQKC